MLSENQQGIFYMHFATNMTSHMIIYDGPVVDYGMEWKIVQTANASAMQARSEDPPPLQLSAILPELCPASSFNHTHKKSSLNHE